MDFRKMSVKEKKNIGKHRVILSFSFLVVYLLLLKTGVIQAGRVLAADEIAFEESGASYDGSWDECFEKYQIFAPNAWLAFADDYVEEHFESYMQEYNPVYSNEKYENLSVQYYSDLSHYYLAVVYFDSEDISILGIDDSSANLLNDMYELYSNDDQTYTGLELCTVNDLDALICEKKDGRDVFYYIEEENVVVALYFQCTSTFGGGMETYLPMLLSFCCADGPEEIAAIDYFYTRMRTEISRKTGGSYSFGYTDTEFDDVEGIWVNFYGDYKLYLPSDYSFSESTEKYAGGVEVPIASYLSYDVRVDLDITYISWKNFGAIYGYSSSEVELLKSTFMEDMYSATADDSTYTFVELCTINDLQVVLYGNFTDFVMQYADDDGIFIFDYNDAARLYASATTTAAVRGECLIFTSFSYVDEDVENSAAESTDTSEEQADTVYSDIQFPVFELDASAYGYLLMVVKDWGTYQEMTDSCSEDENAYYQIPYYENGRICVYDSEEWVWGLLEYDEFIECVTWLDEVHQQNEGDYKIECSSFDITQCSTCSGVWGTGEDSVSISIYSEGYADDGMLMQNTEIGTFALLSTGDCGYVYWQGCAYSEKGQFSAYLQCVTESGVSINLRYSEDDAMYVCSGISDTSLLDGTELDLEEVFIS